MNTRIRNKNKREKETTFPSKRNELVPNCDKIFKENETRTRINNMNIFLR